MQEIPHTHGSKDHIMRGCPSLNVTSPRLKRMSLSSSRSCSPSCSPAFRNPSRSCSPICSPPPPIILPRCTCAKQEPLCCPYEPPKRCCVSPNPCPPYTCSCDESPVIVTCQCVCDAIEESSSPKPKKTISKSKPACGKKKGGCSGAGKRRSKKDPCAKCQCKCPCPCPPSSPPPPPVNEGQVKASICLEIPSMNKMACCNLTCPTMSQTQMNEQQQSSGYQAPRHLTQIFPQYPHPQQSTGSKCGDSRPDVPVCDCCSCGRYEPKPPACMCCPK